VSCGAAGTAASTKDGKTDSGGACCERDAHGRHSGPSIAYERTIGRAVRIMTEIPRDQGENDDRIEDRMEHDGNGTGRVKKI